MFDLKSLDQLGPITDEMLGGLHADEAMRLKIKRAAAEGKTTVRKPKVRFVPAVCCAADAKTHRLVRMESAQHFICNRSELLELIHIIHRLLPPLTGLPVFSLPLTDGLRSSPPEDPASARFR